MLGGWRSKGSEAELFGIGVQSETLAISLHLESPPRSLFPSKQNKERCVQREGGGGADERAAGFSYLDCSLLSTQVDRLQEASRLESLDDSTGRDSFDSRWK